MAQPNPMASVLVIMPLGVDEPKASSNLRFCSVRRMSLRVSASPCENGVVLVFVVSGHSAQSQQEQGFTRRHGAWVLCDG